MPIGTQEILALIIVATVVVAVIYRRWRKAQNKNESSCGCDGKSSDKKTESTVRFYRRQP
jgi:hypothetical protein